MNGSANPYELLSAEELSRYLLDLERRRKELGEQFTAIMSAYKKKTTNG